MRIVSLAEVKAQLSAYVEQAVTDGPIVITRNGKAAAVLIAPVDDDDLETILLSRSKRVQALLEESARNPRNETRQPSTSAKNASAQDASHNQ